MKEFQCDIIIQAGRIMFQVRVNMQVLFIALIALLFCVILVIFNVQLVIALKLFLRFCPGMRVFEQDHSPKASYRIHLSEKRIAAKVEAG